MAHHLVVFVQHRLQFMEQASRDSSEENIHKLNDSVVKSVQHKLVSHKPPMEEVNELQELITNSSVLSECAKRNLVDALGVAEVMEAAAITSAASQEV